MVAGLVSRAEDWPWFIAVRWYSVNCPRNPPNPGPPALMGRRGMTREFLSTLLI
jgi:hypothetical protein